MPAAGMVVSTHSFMVVSTHSFAGCNFVDTGQKLCYNATGPVLCPAPGAALAQDGSYVPGAAQPSYTIYDAGGAMVTVDNRTGLMWVTNSGATTYSWAAALEGCENLFFASYSDWRLPNARELMSLVDYGTDPGPTIKSSFFPGTQANYYWTSTTYVQDPALAWYVDFSAGYLNRDDKVSGASHARCVRGGP
jgi:hypothetical protein